MLEWSFSARRAGPATLEHGQKSVVDESNSVIILHLYRVADRREKKNSRGPFQIPYPYDDGSRIFLKWSSQSIMSLIPVPMSCVIVESLIYFRL